VVATRDEVGALGDAAGTGLRALGRGDPEQEGALGRGREGLPVLASARSGIQRRSEVSGNAEVLDRLQDRL